MGRVSISRGADRLWALHSATGEAHGAEARAEALEAAEEQGVAAAERSFWMAVAARIAREFDRMEGLPVL